MDDMDDIVVIDWKSIPVASTELTAHHSHATSMPARSRPTAESADEDDRPPSSDCKARPDVGLAEHEGAPVNEEKETDHAPADGPYGELQEDVNEGLEGIESSIDLQHQQDIEHSISEDQQRTADSLSISEQDNLERSSSSPTSEDESHPPTTRLRGPEPGPPPPPPLPHLIYQNPPLPPPPLPFNYGFGRRLARGPCPPPPPPPPPPPMPYHDSPSSTGIQPPPPPPPPPPPMTMAGPLPARKRRGCPADLETVHSATQLLPIAISLPPLERIVRLSVGGPNRRAALTHHAATPFDLQAHLWLLRYAEPDRWYARPSAADLRRIRALEAAGLADDIPQQLLLSSSKSSGTAIRPGSTDVVRVWAGAAMGVLCCCPHPFGEEHDDEEEDGSAADMHADDRCRRQIESAFLTYYMVTEAPRALAEEDAGFDAYGPFPPPPPRPVGGARGGGGGGGGGGDEKVYRLEKVGSKDACIARAYHNAALHGWSTVFCCVVQGEVDLRDAEPGLDGFERVGGLAGLVRGGKGDGKKVKVFY